MHQAVASALGQVDIGDGAVRRMPRINGEMCRAVELLIVPDIAEFSTVGERLAGFDLEPDNSHYTPPLRCTGHLYHQFAGPARRPESEQAILRIHSLHYGAMMNFSR